MYPHQQPKLHTAPSVMACVLGSSADEAYLKFVLPRLPIDHSAETQPAKLGWDDIHGAEPDHCRRTGFHALVIAWERIRIGETTYRAMMHPGIRNRRHPAPGRSIRGFVLSVGVTAKMIRRF